MEFEILFVVANILFILASYPNIKAAMKDRNALRGFSYTGAFLTFLGMSTMLIAYGLSSSLMNFILAIPTWLFWGIVTYYNR